MPSTDPEAAAECCSCYEKLKQEWGPFIDFCALEAKNSKNSNGNLKQQFPFKSCCHKSLWEDDALQAEQVQWVKTFDRTTTDGFGAKKVSERTHVKVSLYDSGLKNTNTVRYTIETRVPPGCKQFKDLATMMVQFSSRTSFDDPLDEQRNCKNLLCKFLAIPQDHRDYYVFDHLNRQSHRLTQRKLVLKPRGGRLPTKLTTWFTVSEIEFVMAAVKMRYTHENKFNLHVCFIPKKLAEELAQRYADPFADEWEESKWFSTPTVELNIHNSSLLDQEKPHLFLANAFRRELSLLNGKYPASDANAASCYAFLEALVKSGSSVVELGARQTEQDEPRRKKFFDSTAFKPENCIVSKSYIIKEVPHVPSAAMREVGYVASKGYRRDLPRLHSLRSEKQFQCDVTKLGALAQGQNNVKWCDVVKLLPELGPGAVADAIATVPARALTHLCEKKWSNGMVPLAFIFAELSEESRKTIKPNPFLENVQICYVRPMVDTKTDLAERTTFTCCLRPPSSAGDAQLTAYIYQGHGGYSALCAEKMKAKVKEFPEAPDCEEDTPVLFSDKGRLVEEESIYFRWATETDSAKLVKGDFVPYLAYSKGGKDRYPCLRKRLVRVLLRPYFKDMPHRIEVTLAELTLEKFCDFLSLGVDKEKKEQKEKEVEKRYEEKKEEEERKAKTKEKKEKKEKRREAKKNRAEEEEEEEEEEDVQKREEEEEERKQAKKKRKKERKAEKKKKDEEEEAARKKKQEKEKEQKDKGQQQFKGTGIYAALRR